MDRRFVSGALLILAAIGVLSATAAKAKGPPVDVAVAGGLVWVTGGEAGAPVRGLDPETGRVVAAVRAGRFPAHLATGFGSLWVAGQDGIRVHRISPRNERVLARIEVGHPIWSLVAGAGAVWAAGVDRRHKGLISRIDPASGRVTGRFHLGRGGGPSIATGLGALWIAILGPPGRQDHHRLLRLDGASRAISARLVLPGYASDLAAGRGAMWVAVPERPGRLVRVDPLGRRATSTRRIGFNPVALLVGREAGWLVSPCGPPDCDVDEGFLTRFDPRSGRALGSPVALRRESAAAALSPAAVWVVGAAAAAVGVTRVDRRSGEPSHHVLEAGPPDEGRRHVRRP